MTDASEESFRRATADKANSLADPMFALRVALSMFFEALFEASEPTSSKAVPVLANEMKRYIRAMTFFVQRVGLGTSAVEYEAVQGSARQMLDEHRKLMESVADTDDKVKAALIKQNIETGQMKQFQFQLTRTFVEIGRFIVNRTQTSETAGVQTTAAFDQKAYKEALGELAKSASRYPFASGVRRFKEREKAEYYISLIVSLFATAVVMSTYAAEELNLAVLRGIKYRQAPVAPAPAPEMGAAPAPSQYGGVPAALPPIAQIPPPLPSVYKN